uniref:PAK4-inhibitor INKA2 n=1 Tax=Poecilia formosa TaxID=48698 RepID=A0A087XD42_POEFO
KKMKIKKLRKNKLSMREAGDGLHAQMNSMMGALQELKLLQVQTALESLDISGRPINRGIPHPASTTAQLSAASALGLSEKHESVQRPTMPEEPSTSPVPSLRLSLDSRNSLSRDDQTSSRNRSSMGFFSSSASSLESESESESQRSGTSTRSENNIESIPKRWSGYTAPQVDFYGPMDSADDASDWTSSLMSRSRNRQPLVLGDNVFADLVGNWLDLPEVEREADTPAHPLRLSRSQEICKKFSLTTNIFKKFLRSVRPDRDKLLKERPGWMAPELSEGDLFKRPKKAAPKASKGSFYLPFWANGQQGKGRPCPHLAEAERKQQPYQPFPQFYQQPFPGIYLDRRQPEMGLEKRQPLFDYNTAVWV